MLDKVKLALRLSGTALDGEVSDLINAAIADLRLVGINIPAEAGSSSKTLGDPLLDRAVVLYGSDSDEAPYTAIGFRAKKAGGTYKYIWLYKVKFAIPDENYTTKGDSIEFTTPEIVGQFIKRSDGLWKAEHVAEPTNSVATAWFTSVREPNNAGG